MDTIHHSTMQDLLGSLPADSVDLIFTDPPYNRDAIPLYGELAALAERVLKPGGFCLAMSGGLYLDEILNSMAKHLNFYWMFHISIPGAATPVRPRGNRIPVIAKEKPIHAFIKGWGQPRTVIIDPYTESVKDKRFHDWGQDEKSARYYIDCITNEGDLVVDPLCGGGTTPFVCQSIGRHYIAGDSDLAAVEMTRNRLRNPLFIPRKDQQMVLDFAK